MASDNWIATVAEAKWQARSCGGYVVAVVCSRGCGHCKTAERLVWTTEQWAAYAALNKLFPIKVWASTTQASQLRRLAKFKWFPTVYVLRVRGSADLASNALTENEVEVVGQFLYRKGQKVNGKRIGAIGLKSWFAALDSYEL